MHEATQHVVTNDAHRPGRDPSPSRRPATRLRAEGTDAANGKDGAAFLYIETRATMRMHVIGVLVLDLLRRGQGHWHLPWWAFHYRPVDLRTLPLA